jgi:hypothetical protein
MLSISTPKLCVILFLYLWLRRKAMAYNRYFDQDRHIPEYTKDDYEQLPPNPRHIRLLNLIGGHSNNQDLSSRRILCELVIVDISEDEHRMSNDMHSFIPYEAVIKALLSAKGWRR